MRLNEKYEYYLDRWTLFLFFIIGVVAYFSAWIGRMASMDGFGLWVLTYAGAIVSCMTLVSFTAITVLNTKERIRKRVKEEKERIREMNNLAREMGEIAMEKRRIYEGMMHYYPLGDEEYNPYGYIPGGEQEQKKLTVR